MSLMIPPGSDFVFHVVRVSDSSWNVLDSRTRTVVANHATQALAKADAITRNQAEA